MRLTGSIHMSQSEHFFSRHQRRQLMILSIILVISMISVCFLIFKPKTTRLKDEPLTTKELSSFMSFYEYDAREWERYFLKNGFEEKVTWENLEDYLYVLGIKDYVNLGKKSGIVKHSDFVKVYDQILGILDGEHLVESDKITVSKNIPAKDEWNSGTIGAKDILYLVTTKIEKYRTGLTYNVYRMGDVILGMRGIQDGNLPSEAEAAGSTLKDSDEVKVLLRNGASLYRKKVYLTVSGDYIRNSSKGNKKTVSKGSILSFTKKGTTNVLKESECITLMPNSKNGRIYLTTKNGTKVSKGYRGTFKIYLYKSGYIIINQLPIKEYLYGVVPSEMPSGYHEEALKAQAICARSYAYRQISTKNQLAKYYAQLDDSTAYQVYNKSNEAESTIKAVNDTKNRVVKYKGAIATTYYYSTSCGIKQNYSLWGGNANTAGYLQSGIIHKKSKTLGKGSKSTPDLSTEKKFKEFIDKVDAGYFESQYKYFRWSANFNIEKNQDALEKAIVQRRKEAAATVAYFDKNGKLIADMKKLGKPVKCKVTKRLSSGAIKELTITYENGKVVLKNEYTIRYCISSCKAMVTLQDNTKTEMQLLPSACFYIKSTKDGNVTLKGGGFGHGLGMSQNGANEMAKAGYTYKEIIQFFYDGVTV